MIIDKVNVSKLALSGSVSKIMSYYLMITEINRNGCKFVVNE